ncbi:MAG: HlyD family secretion protein [Alphaproteobacteria bacterium]|nr:HlyD family secretion protein [Alphaproteobacteria bacterium]
MIPPGKARESRIAARPIRLALIAGIVIAALAVAGREVWLRATHVYESDARVMADIFTMSSRAEGFVVELAVREGARVEAGQVLVRLDDRAAKLRADALQAQIAAVQADRQRLRAERRLIDSQTETKARTRGAGVEASSAARQALDADILLARQELDRSRQLAERKVITDRQLETAVANVARLEGTRRRLEAEHLQAENSVAEALAERERLAVIDGQLAGLDHTEANLAAMLRQQLVDVEDRTIRSPVSGVIDRTFVLVGEFVGPGQRLVILHDPAAVWVEANIKETQLRHLATGQGAAIAVDAFPSDRFTARVARIGSSTTARFALLPTPNPSGNFTKVTQRVPVKLELVNPPRALTPGMMVEVAIELR